MILLQSSYHTLVRGVYDHVGLRTLEDKNIFWSPPPNIIISPYSK